MGKEFQAISRTCISGDEFPNSMKEVQSFMTFDTAITNSMKLVRFRVYFNFKLLAVCFDTLCQFEGKI